MKMKNKTYARFGLIYFILLTLISTSLDAQSVKVFILAGQSNMQGQGEIEPSSTVGTLSHFMENDPTANEFWYIQHDVNEWVEQDDVWVRYKQEDGSVLAENLTVGLGASQNQIGPELTFGHVIKEESDSRVLIVKTAWGGKSLAVDFRPPSSGGETGFYYNQMLLDVNEAIENLEFDFPSFEAGGEVEIAGFCWFQGWNDGDELAFAQEYEQNLNNLISDLRVDLDSPELPFVVALTGHGGYDLEPEGTWLGNLQHHVLPAQINVIENGGHEHVAYVDTRAFWPEADQSPEEDFGFHWYNNAECFLKIGAGLGDAMFNLLGGEVEEEDEEDDQNNTFCSCGNCGLSYNTSSNSTPHQSVPCLGSVRPNTNAALPESYNYQEYVFPEPDDQGTCLGMQNTTATIEEVFISQTHRHPIGHPLHFTIGERPALFQMAVTGTGATPDIQVEGILNGVSLGTLCLGGPAVLSETIDLATANFDEYFSVTLPKSWVSIGLELRLTAGNDNRTLTQEDLNIRPYTELNLVLVNMDIMDYNHEPHRRPIYDNFLQELASAIPASTIRFGQFPGDIVMPDFALNNQEDNTVILSTNEMVDDNNVNTGMINFQANLLIDAMRLSTGDSPNTIYFGNTLNLDPGGWGGDGSFVSFEYNDVFIHELGHALSLPHWVEDYRRVNPNPDQYAYPFAGEEQEASGRGDTWSFNQATYQFISPTCEDSSGEIGTERSDAMQRGYYCAENRTNGKGPWDGFGAFSAMAMSNYLLGSTPYWGQVEDRGEVIDFHFRENDGFPIASIVNGERVFTRHPSQPQNTFKENDFRLPGNEQIKQEAYLIYGTAHATNMDANIIYEPIPYNGTILPVIDPTDPEMFDTLQNMSNEDAPEFYGRTRDITLKLTYIDGTTKHVLVPFQSFDRPDFFPGENPRPAYFAVSVPADELLCNVEMYHRDFVILDEFDGELGNINDPSQNITAANFMDEAVLMTTLDHSCNCPGTPSYVEPGTPCDDGNPLTVNDVEDGFCNCIGELIEPCGFIENGQFQESTVNWWTWGADFTVENGEANIENIEIDDAGMAQGLFPLNQGDTYRVSFDAYADVARSIELIIYFEEESEVSFNSENIDIGTLEENYEYIFTMTDPSTTAAALEFNFRFSTSAVHLDNICFEEYCGGALEIPYNGIDDDCNPMTLDDDLDQDGYAVADDCDDTNPDINPGAEDIANNSIDEDCDGFDAFEAVDNDNDGYDNSYDCDDNNPDINPGVTETLYNGIDDDCDPLTLDDDLDQDGFAFANDCDDNNAQINPNQTEIPYNGLDDDCNSTTLDDDLDLDGFNLADDCDDNNSEINPNQAEVPYNGIDDDCNTATLDDDLDQDGFEIAEDCDDNNAEINPDATDIPNNGIDENCDGMDLITSTNELIQLKLSIYPNPAKHHVNIAVDNVTNFSVSILNLEGKIITSLNNSYTIDVTLIPTGMYILEFVDLITGQKTLDRILIVK